MEKDLQTSRVRGGRISTIFVVFLALTALTAPARADALPPIIAGVARNLPVLARNGMVAAQEKIAARIGLDVLKRGGNAVDAAVATGFALAVTLPRAGNLGGGGFMVVHLAKENRDIALDYRETAPAAVTADVFLDASGEADPRKSRDSGLGVGTPGTVAGLAYARDRRAFGQAIIDFQNSQFVAADSRCDLDLAWLAAIRAARLLDRGERAAMECSMAKLAASEACGRVVDRMLQLHGGYGYSEEQTIERLYRDARITRIYEGTSEIQRLVIARELLRRG